MNYERIADEIRVLGAELSQMRERREAQETARVEAAKLAEKNKKATQEISGAAASPVADPSFSMLTQEQLLSMNSKQLQDYISSV